MTLYTNCTHKQKRHLTYAVLWLPLALSLYYLSYWCYSRRKKRESWENTIYYQIMKNLNFVNPQFLNQQSEDEKVKVIKNIHEMLQKQIGKDILNKKARESEKALMEEEADMFSRSYS